MVAMKIQKKKKRMELDDGDLQEISPNERNEK